MYKPPYIQRVMCNYGESQMVHVNCRIKMMVQLKSKDLISWTREARKLLNLTRESILSFPLFCLKWTLVLSWWLIIGAVIKSFGFVWPVIALLFDRTILTTNWLSFIIVDYHSRNSSIALFHRVQYHLKPYEMGEYDSYE